VTSAPSCRCRRGPCADGLVFTDLVRISILVFRKPPPLRTGPTGGRRVVGAVDRRARVANGFESSVHFADCDLKFLVQISI